MSQAAIDIDRAHRLLKVCLGTQYERAARRNLEAVVERVRTQQVRS